MTSKQGKHQHSKTNDNGHADPYNQSDFKNRPHPDMATSRAEGSVNGDPFIAPRTFGKVVGRLFFIIWRWVDNGTFLGFHGVRLSTSLAGGQA